MLAQASSCKQTTSVFHRKPERSRLKIVLCGFSIIELMVVVAIVAVVAVIAVPSFNNMLRSNRLASATSALQLSLNLARSEAVKRGSDARVTVAANETAGSWAKGWTVFVDRTADAHSAIGPSTDDSSATGWTRLEIAAAPSGSLSVSQTGMLKYFSFSGQGRVVDIDGAPAARSFWFFDGVSQKYCLIIDNTGRVRTERVDGAASCPLA